MKRWVSVFTTINASALVIWVLYSLFFSNKIAYVDSNKLINGYQGMTQARKEYQVKAGIWKANIDTLVKEVQLEITKYNKEKKRMSPKEKELSEKLIMTKQQQLTDYQKATKEKASSEDAAVTKKVIDEINAQIKDYGKRHGYKIVLAATEYGNIAYANDDLDITEQVLEELNSNYIRTKAK